MMPQSPRPAPRGTDHPALLGAHSRQHRPSRSAAWSCCGWRASQGRQCAATTLDDAAAASNHHHGHCSARAARHAPPPAHPPTMPAGSSAAGSRADRQPCRTPPLLGNPRGVCALDVELVSAHAAAAAAAIAASLMPRLKGATILRACRCCGVSIRPHHTRLLLRGVAIPIACSDPVAILWCLLRACCLCRERSAHATTTRHGPAIITTSASLRRDTGLAAADDPSRAGRDQAATSRGGGATEARPRACAWRIAAAARCCGGGCAIAAAAVDDAR